MTTQTKIDHIIFNAARDSVSEVLRDAAEILNKQRPKMDLPNLGIMNQSVDIYYGEDYYIEVSVKLIKRII